MSKLFLRALRIAAMRRDRRLSRRRGPTHGLAAETIRASASDIVVAFLATTLPSVLQDLMAGRFPRKLAFSDENQPEQALG